MEFDDLKRAWRNCDDHLDTGLHLNTNRLRLLIRSKPGVEVHRRSVGLDWQQWIAKLQDAVLRVLQRHRVVRG